MRTRVGINGMGWVGRAVLRGILERAGTAVEVVAVNDLAPVPMLAHLLRYDSTYGRWSAAVDADAAHLPSGGGWCGCSASPTRQHWTGARSASTWSSRPPAGSAPASRPRSTWPGEPARSC